MQTQLSEICSRPEKGLSQRQLSFVFASTAIIIAVIWELTTTTTLLQRAMREVILYIIIPLTLARFFGERLGWRFSREAFQAGIVLTLAIVPVYFVGASIPQVRAAYPMWQTHLSFSTYIPYTIGIFLVILATETYYRGLLCLGFRHLGPFCIFIHVPLYMYRHITSPPIEFYLSGIGGVLFAGVDYRTNSILPSVMSHYVGFMVLDILVRYPPLLSMPESVIF